MSEETPPPGAASSGPAVSHKAKIFARIAQLFARRKGRSEVKFVRATIGDAQNRVVRVIAFSAGGADNVFQFGMVHAFLVSDAPKPHIVAGTSSGAVVAAMLADVLQAGESYGSEAAARRLAQTAHFRALLAQIEQAPTDLKEASFPDFTEVSARAGLKPLDLPTQQEQEKRDRKTTALARFGLTRLVNVLLASRVKFSELTRIVRLILDLQASSEWRWNWGRRGLPAFMVAAIEGLVLLWLVIWKGFSIWLQILVPAVRDAPLLLRRGVSVALEAIIPRRLSILRDRLAFSRLQSAKRILFEPWLVQVSRIVLVLFSYPVVALTWLFAPPGVVVLGVGKRIAGRIPDREWRNLALRFTGVLILMLTGWIGKDGYHQAANVYRDLFDIVASHQIQDLAPAFYDLEHLRRGLFHVLCGILPVLGPGVVFAALTMVFSPGSNGAQMLALFLAGFGIKKDLLTPGVLRKLLMRAFDPFFFGKRDFDEALNLALGGAAQRADHEALSPDNRKAADPSAQNGMEEPLEGQRTLGDWVWKKTGEHGVRAPKAEPILVAPVAADVGTGRLVILEPATATVDALTAACALTPFFGAMNLKVTPGSKNDPSEAWLVDGSCVAGEPIQPVLELIKRLNLNQRYPRGPDGTPGPFADLGLVEEPEFVDLCVISPFPTRRLRERERRQMAEDIAATPKVAVAVAESKLPKPPGILYRLGEIFSLRAAHAAKDERTLVTMYNAMLKPFQDATGKAFFCSRPEQSESIDSWDVRANLRELEPAQPVRLVANLVRCTDDAAKRSLLLRTIANGCRASLEGLYWNKLVRLAEEATAGGQAGNLLTFPPCRKLQDLLKVKELPGILEPRSPPGVTEICRECRFYSEPEASWGEIRAAHAARSQTTPGSEPDWGEVPRASRPLDIRAYLPKAEPCTGWPRDRERSDGALERGTERPLVSVVFSGGGFRGVFQVGVLNAFCLAGVKPDVVAGASVGTIMAALAARAFTESEEARQKHRVARIAATFLAVDRLVLTDRFADFIRRFTLRFASARFSFRDADHLFRQFDQRKWELLTRRSRRVLAGIHRIAYMDPLEVLGLLSLHSPQKRGQLADRVLLCAQDALNRAGVGTELLGAEPLELLIRAHVLPNLEDQGAEFKEFLRGGIHFLATTTNLRTGELDVLGSFCNPLRQPALVPGLLASSAFPGVFRPRMNWELRAGSPGLPEELIDGGVADNLPIIPVYRFLFYAGYKGWLKLRPTVDSEPGGRKEARPHLLLTASLEPRRRVLKGKELQRVAECWPWLRSRTAQLQYNVKVDSHRETQHDLRRICEALRKQIPGPSEVELPDLHISCVKPEWLCGTFAFHPMLGFRRTRQAQNIAHGCASTLVHLHREQEKHAAWTEHWWVRIKLRPGVCLPEENSGNGPEEGRDNCVRLRPSPPDVDGNCCFVEGRKCPFSKPELERVKAALAPNETEDQNREPLSQLGRETAMALQEIYRRCGERKTHQRAEQ